MIIKWILIGAALFVSAVMRVPAFCSRWTGAVRDETKAPNELIGLRQPVQSGELRCEKPVYDFGRVKVGKPIRHAFPMQNVGKDTVWVRVKQPGVGSRAKSIYKIEPQQTVMIPVSLFTSRINGPVEKRIIVEVVDRR